MILTYCYRILPDDDQVATLDNWMELLRRHWNYALGQRLDWLNSTRCQIDILEAVAVKRGVHIVKVNPHNTSQNCSGCGTLVPKTLSIRTHSCHKCGLTMDRDENAAKNILERGLNAVGHMVTAQGGFENTQPVNCETSRIDRSKLSIKDAPIIP